jgi:diketogulonate reductase-like aldo/keto reductase
MRPSPSKASRFGTFRVPGAAAQSVVVSALALGYRHIDTAAMYENEAAVGAAVIRRRKPRQHRA